MSPPDEHIKPGDYFLSKVLDHRGDYCWAFWWRRKWHGKLVDTQLVNSKGEPGDIEDVETNYGTQWDTTDDITLYRVRPENVDAIVMAARHMTTEQWERFAWRQSERQFLDVASGDLKQ